MKPVQTTELAAIIFEAIGGIKRPSGFTADQFLAQIKSLSGSFPYHDLTIEAAERCARYFSHCLRDGGSLQ